MKCKKCGHVTRSLKAMAAHYRKKHPKSMKKKRISKKTGRSRRSKNDVADLLRQILAKLDE